MSKTKAKKTNNETYTISRNTIKASGQPGRKPSRLGNTMRMLNIGDGFMYPYTSKAATFNIRRAARSYGLEMTTKRTEKGVFAIRCA